MFWLLFGSTTPPSMSSTRSSLSLQSPHHRIPEMLRREGLCYKVMVPQDEVLKFYLKKDQKGRFSFPRISRGESDDNFVIQKMCNGDHISEDLRLFSLKEMQRIVTNIRTNVPRDYDVHFDAFQVIEWYCGRIGGEMLRENVRFFKDFLEEWGSYVNANTVRRLNYQ